MSPNSKAIILGIVRVVPDLRERRLRRAAHRLREPALLLALAQEIPILDLGDLEAMIEELEDIRALDGALAKPARRMIPFEVTSTILDGVGKRWEKVSGTFSLFSARRSWREGCAGEAQGGIAPASRSMLC
jgi:hypothetical protein